MSAISNAEVLIFVMPALGIVIAFFAAWYKQDRDTDTKIENARRESKREIDDARNEVKKESDKVENRLAAVRMDVDNIKSSAVSRHEHDRDMDKLQNEIRGFRDEVREDIRTLNSNLTARLDLMIERVLDLKPAKKDA